MDSDESCEICGKRSDGENISFRECCDIGCCSNLCGRCAKRTETRDCDECGRRFCERLGEFETRECCGMVFCGMEGESGCAKDHVQQKLTTCGHMTCNYRMTAGCHMCLETEKENQRKDKEAVKKLLETASSKTLKKKLSKWLASAPPSPRKQSTKLMAPQKVCATKAKKTVKKHEVRKEKA